MAVVDVSNIGVGDVIAGGGIGQFNPTNPLLATQRDAASFSESDEGGGDGQLLGTTTTTVTNTTGAVSNVPTSRIISFTVTSTPSGASILLNGVNTSFITPHVMQFQETELLTPKIISVVNGTNNSLETFILTSEVVTTTTGATATNGTSAGSGGGSGRGTAGSGAGGSDSVSNDPLQNRGPEYGIAGESKDRNNAQK